MVVSYTLQWTLINHSYVTVSSDKNSKKNNCASKEGKSMIKALKFLLRQHPRITPKDK